jgi:hypothetical protein
MKMITTQDQYYRAVQALNETGFLIIRASAYTYMPELEKLDYLASLEKHTEKLISMIAQWEQMDGRR